MNDIILLKQGEIVLKGLNKKYFEQKLAANAARRLKPFGSFHIYTIQSTTYGVCISHMNSRNLIRILGSYLFSVFAHESKWRAVKWTCMIMKT